MFIDYEKAFDGLQQYYKLMQLIKKFDIDQNIQYIEYLYWNQTAQIKLDK